MQNPIETRRNVVDLRSYRRENQHARPTIVASAPARLCRHCGAWMADDESEDDCSSVFRALESVGIRV